MELSAYLDHAALMAELRELVARGGGRLRLLSLGRSREGREIPLAAVGPDDRPALLVEANTHAGEVTGSAAALALLRRLAEPAADDREAAAVLATRTVYVVPRLAVDGAEVYLHTPAMLRSAPVPYPWPEWPAGLYPEDLDGDGRIRLMRRVDPLGEWRADPRDDRLLVRRQPDDRDGPFYRVTPEGLLREAGEDEPGPLAGDGRALPPVASRYGLDFNRNYPVHWRPQGSQPGGGPFPLSEPETRALAQFVAARPNLCAVLSLHTSGGVILRPPAEGGEESLPAVDRWLLQGLGDAGERLTGYPCRSTQAAFNAGAGGRPTVKGFDDWCYEHRGLAAYTMELWDLDSRAGVAGYAQVGVAGLLRRSEAELAEDERRRLAWNDRVLGGAGFKPWTPFHHPQLGRVEIGGWDPKFVRQNPPPQLLGEECRRAVDFALCLALATPRLRLTAAAEPLAPGVARLRVRVANEGYLPTSATQRAVEAKVVADLAVTVDGGRVLDGPATRRLGQLDGYGCMPRGPWGPPAQADSERWLDFVVAAPAGATVTVTATHARAGRVTAAVQLPAGP